MDGDDWLKHILENMQSDINEIKNDIKALSEWKWRVAGGVAVMSAILTIAINLVHIWVRA